MTTKEYFQNITQSFGTLTTGVRLTFRHFTKSISRKRLRNTTPANDINYFRDEVGIVTLQYPKEKLPIPDVGRYQLDVEIDDCIVCDKCAKICPVNCIDIEAVKAGEQIGTTSDGTPMRLYAAKFDIDMAKCCFCGLCTTVCPTECITMTNKYDYSVFDVLQLNFPFSKMTDAEVTLRKEEADEREKKKAEKILTDNSSNSPVENVDKNPTAEVPSAEKPIFKPKFKPMIKK